MPGGGTDKHRRKCMIFNRDKWICQLMLTNECRAREGHVRDYHDAWKNIRPGDFPVGFPWDDMATVDHIIRRADRGTSDPSNLRTACYACNHEKGRQDYEHDKFDQDATNRTKHQKGKWQVINRPVRVVEVFRNGQKYYVIKVFGTKIRYPVKSVV